MAGSGIIRLTHMVRKVVEENDDFRNTVYGGYPIVRVTAKNQTRTQKMRNPQHPNLLRKGFTAEYLRVHLGAEDESYPDLLLAIRDKLANNIRIKEAFQDRIIFVDDPDDPKLEGGTMQKPYLAIHDADYTSPYLFSGQREEALPVEFWIYQQRFPANMSESLIGK